MSDLSKFPIERIRNFSIIAHIDHGKSTLSDRLIQHCGGLEDREMKAQVLDSMEIEQERGITIKAQTVRLFYKAQDGETYMLNFMDTPGHVDFSYEVSRSLAACEGAVLVVDASQGVEAQTLANVYLSLDCDHEILVALNKIDLPAADPERVKNQIEEVIGLDASGAIPVSAKTGVGIPEILEGIVKNIPAPAGDPSAPLKALLVDSWYDPYLGVVILVRVFEGTLKKGLKIRMMQAEDSYTAERIGFFTPKKIATDALYPGEVGFITGSIKQVSDCKIGDTITEDKRVCDGTLPGFKPNLPVVFCSLFPSDASDYEKLKESVAMLRLNDSGFSYEQENSAALGIGFRCGFLGLLHLEIVQERLEREYNIDLITTAPSVAYILNLSDGTEANLHNPADVPDAMKIRSWQEPWIKATIMSPDEYLGAILTLCTNKRGEQTELSYVGNRALIKYRLPLNEVVFDFYDRLKSISRGYASFEWEHDTYEESDLVKVNILINGEPVDALALITHRSQAEKRGRDLCVRLKDLIPRQLFKVAIQAAIGGKIIARETVSAMRKDVTAKCYGGDISRKRKLLDKQKKGKKKMRNIGNVEVPQSAFIQALKISDD